MKFYNCYTIMAGQDSRVSIVLVTIKTRDPNFNVAFRHIASFRCDATVRLIDPKRASGRSRSPLPQLSPCIWGKCKGAGGRVNASIFLYHDVRAGSRSGLRLVFRALQTSRNLFGAACSRDLLCLRAADGEWSDIRSQRVCGRASHAAFRIAGNGDESSEREVCYCGD